MVSTIEVVSDDDLRTPIEERIVVKTLTAVLINFDAHFWSDYRETVNALQGMGAHFFMFPRK